MRALIVNIVTLISVILSLWYSRANPRILIFACLMVMLIRIVLIQLMLVLYRKYTSEAVRDFLQKIVQTSPPGPPPQGMYDTHTGKEVGFGGSMLVLGSLVLFTFFLTHVNAEKELDFQFPVFLYEMKWALWIFLIYELKDLIWKGIIIDFNLPAEKNFAYNAAEIVL